MARRENVKLRATDKKVPSHSFLPVVCATVSWYFAVFFFLGGLASFPDYSSALCFSISAVLLPLKAWRVVLRKIGVYGFSKVVFAIALVLSLDRTFTLSFRIAVVSFAALFSCYRTFRDRKREESDELPDGDEESQAEHPLENSEELFWSGDAKSDKRKVILTHLFLNTYIDELFPVAVDAILETGQASTSILQRRLKLGYSRAARLIDEMERNGYVGSFQGSAPRRILIKREQWEKIRATLHHKSPAPTIDTAQIIRDEENWRRERLGLSPIEYELQKIDGMRGHAFEEWCADLLKRNGFSSVEVTPGSGDQGVDITAEKDGLKYAVQCKRYASDLGNTPIQEVVAGKAFYRCNVAAVMTNQHFTSGAKELASINGVLLWDRETIIDMLKQEKSQIT